MKKIIEGLWGKKARNEEGPAFEQLGKAEQWRHLQTFFAQLPLSKKKILGLQALRMTEALDYAKRKLLIDVSSLEELTRLKSATKEPLTVKWLETCLQADDVVYDIGANIGAYAMIAASTHPGKVSVYAFEPVASNYDKLVKNLLLNELEEAIYPLPIALSDKSTLGKIHLIGNEPGRGTHSLDKEQYARNQDRIEAKRKDEKKAYTLPAITFRLDDLIDQFNLPPPQHLKLDIEGHEYAVLQGAEKTLASGCIKTLSLELWDAGEHAVHKARIIDLLKQHGYDVVATERKKNKQGQNDSFSYAVFGKSPIPGLTTDA